MDALDTIVYAAARRVADIFFEYATDDPRDDPRRPYYRDLRNNEVDPLYSQTLNGLYLHCTQPHGLPDSLWTPWGEWKFRGVGSDDLVFSQKWLGEQVARHWRAELFREQVRDTRHDRYDGPVLALLSVENVILPPPSLPGVHNYKSPEQALTEWRRLTAEYPGS